MFLFLLLPTFPFEFLLEEQNKPLRASKRARMGREVDMKRVTEAGKAPNRMLSGLMPPLDLWWGS
jgi:hypothetical protein